jgi:hypothetical protein
VNDEPPKKHVHHVVGLGFTVGEQKAAKRQRKPTLRAALEAAKAAGRPVKSATVKDGEIVLEFGEPTPDTSDEWDKKLAELDRGKH